MSDSIPAFYDQPEPPAEPVQQEPIPEAEPISAIGILGSSFVLPCFSPGFYQQAVRRKVSSAVIFFFIFGLVLTLFSTLGVVRSMLAFRENIRQVFTSGEFPEITIQNGIATSSSPVPVILSDGSDMVFIIDTSGTTRRLDTSRYKQGVLLTQTSLHVVNSSGRYQTLPLTQVQTLFHANPLLINADTVTRGWNTLSFWLAVLAFFGLLFWNTVDRLVYLLILALPVWLLVSLLNPGIRYKTVLTAGLYAAVPALYLHYMLGRINVRFFAIFTVLQVVAWLLAMVAVALSPREPKPIHIEYWRAWIGLPMLIFIAWDMIFTSSRGWIVIWVVTAITGILLIGMNLFEELKPEPTQAS